MSTVSKFVKSSAIYFVGNVLTKIISFFLLPLYTNYIATGDMGYFDLASSWINMLAPVLCFEIWSGIMRYMFDYAEDWGKYKAIFNGSVILLGSLIVYVVLTFALGFIIEIPYLMFIFFYGLFTALQTVYTYIARGLGYSTVFAVSGIVGGLVNSLSNIFMILVLGMRLDSMFIAVILGLFSQCVIMEWKVKLYKNLSVKMFDKALIKDMIRFSVPLSINSACFWFLSSYNKVGVSSVLGLEANGIYAVAGKFTYILGLVSNCFSMALQELVYSMGNEKDNKANFYTMSSNYYLKFLMFGLVMLIPAVSIVFPFLIGSDYNEAYGIVPLYLMATVVSIYSNFLGNIFGAEKKTNIITISTILGAAVNVSLFHLLVGTMGIQAANVSLLLGFLVNVIMRLMLLKRDFPIKLDYFMLIFTTLLFIVAFAVYMFFGIEKGTGVCMAANGICLLVMFGITLFAFRDLLKKGLDMVKSKKQK